MSSSLKGFHRSGNFSVWLSVFVLVSGLVSGLALMLGVSNRQVGRKIVASRSLLRNASTAETTLVAFRLAELQYLNQTSACGSVRPLVEALGRGTGCGVPVTLFNTANTTDPGVVDGIYRFVGAGCTLTAAGSNCNGRTQLLQINLPALISGGSQGSVATLYLDSVQPAKSLLEFSVEVDEGGRRSRFSFGILGGLVNSAHLEGDGRVTQPNPDRLSVCRGTVWGTMEVYNPVTRRCESYGQFASGTGLVMYAGRYFGMHSERGDFIDLEVDSPGPSYMVSEAGDVGGRRVFVPHSRDLLLNTDDATAIGRQLYFVSDAGAPQIGVLDMRAAPRRGLLCDLAARGWSQSFEGLGAAGSSDPLLPESGDGYPANSSRLATFYLKTSGGQLLTALVQGFPPGVPAVSPAPIASFGGWRYTCAVSLDPGLQQVEFTRTYGFDRVPGQKPYLLY